MHSRRFACFLLGLWLGGALLVAWVASQNFRTGDRLLTTDDPEAMLRLKAVGDAAEGRALIRHAASEENRDLLETWEYAQLFLGLFFFAFLLLGTGEGKISLAMALLMVLIVVIQRFALTPYITGLGRTLDFARNGGPHGEQARFSVLHGIYIGLELAKWAAAALLASILVLQRSRRSGSGHTRKQVNVVDKANHGHIDR